jgi:CRP-like cAMP-binding protein
LVVGVLYVVSAIGVLRQAGLNPSEALATGAVTTAVLALSLQSTLVNVIGGVALQLDGSIREGDWIQLENGRQGRVTDVRWRHTMLETRDWDTLIVPNSVLLTSQFMVLGRRDGKAVPRRYWVRFHVDHSIAPSRVIQVVTEALHGAPIDRVASDPKPNVICEEMAHERRHSFSLYAVRYWLTDLAHDDPTSSAVRARIHAALRRAGIPLAKPLAAVVVSKDTEGAREQKQRADLEEKAAALATCDLFRTLSKAEQLELAQGMRYAPFCAGEVITKQGAVAHWLYILTSGHAEIRARMVTKKNEVSEDRFVRALEAPAFFGEMGLMTGEPRLASVVATTDVECFRLDRAGFARIITERPELTRELADILATRRVELQAVLDGTGGASKQAQRANEEARIFGAIQRFFGLS